MKLVALRRKDRHDIRLLIRRLDMAHATAVDGHPGGYPVVFRDGAVHLDLPSDVTLEEAVQANLEGQLRDGIAAITAEGDAVLSDHARAIMRDVLGWEYERYRVADAPEMAVEISRRYREFAQRVMRAA